MRQPVLAPRRGAVIRLLLANSYWFGPTDILQPKRYPKSWSDALKTYEIDSATTMIQRMADKDKSD